MLDGKLYCLFDRDTEWAIVKRVRTTHIEGGFLVESDDEDKRRYLTMICGKPMRKGTPRGSTSSAG